MDRELGPKLVKKIKEVLASKFDEFLADSIIRVNCKRLGIKFPYLDLSQFPELMKRIEISLMLFLSDEERKEIIRKINEEYQKVMVTQSAFEIPTSQVPPPALEQFIKIATDKLEKKIEELEKEKAVLEEKVRERTAKLEERARDLEKARIALLNILEDVEEARQRAEAERNKTLVIIQNLADGLLFFDKENKLALINSQAEIFFQIKRQDLIGKSVAEIRNLDTFAPLKSILTDEFKPIHRKEIVLRENLVLEVSVILLNVKGEKMGSLIVLHDVTREKLVERLKTEFVSISAHQLRTPLSAIKWILKMMLDGDLGPLQKEQKEFLEKAFYSNERMINLINDLLNITRIEEGRFLFTFKPVDVLKLTEEIVNSFKDMIENKKINLEFKKPVKQPILVEADIEKLKLAIENLIDNAITYTPPGGKITLTLQDNKEVLFSIKDTGIGIPEDQQGRIFSKFFRARNAIKMETEGSGLGLYITKNIIEAHGGKIWFESKENQGTTFYFTLPHKKV